MRRHILDHRGAGMTGFPFCCDSVLPKTVCGVFLGGRAASVTASWRAAMTVRSETPTFSARPTSARLTLGVRYLILSGILVGAVGLAGRFLTWPLLTSTIGPTAYVFAAHPDTEPARFRNALAGHGVAFLCGLAALAAFGLTRYPSISTTGSPSLRQVGAAVTGVGLTVLLLELVGSHHAPAAATALLITTGLAKPGAPLIGLAVGLAIVIALGPLVGRLPLSQALSRVPTMQRASRKVDA